MTLCWLCTQLPSPPLTYTNLRRTADPLIWKCLGLEVCMDLLMVRPVSTHFFNMYSGPFSTPGRLHALIL